jgi:hypothetical protein
MQSKFRVTTYSDFTHKINTMEQSSGPRGLFGGDYRESFASIGSYAGE